jgi:hypothetical protein
MNPNQELQVSIDEFTDLFDPDLQEWYLDIERINNIEEEQNFSEFNLNNVEANSTTNIGD